MMPVKNEKIESIENKTSKNMKVIIMMAGTLIQHDRRQTFKKPSQWEIIREGFEARVRMGLFCTVL